MLFLAAFSSIVPAFCNHLPHHAKGTTPSLILAIALAPSPYERFQLASTPQRPCCGNPCAQPKTLWEHASGGANCVTSPPSPSFHSEARCNRLLFTECHKRKYSNSKESGASTATARLNVIQSTESRSSGSTVNYIRLRWSTSTYKLLLHCLCCGVGVLEQQHYMSPITILRMFYFHIFTFTFSHFHIFIFMCM